jgi:hypothetical protein
MRIVPKPGADSDSVDITVGAAEFSDVGFIQAIFQTASLCMKDLGIIVGLAATGTSMGLHEMRRRYERKRDADET